MTNPAPRLSFHRRRYILVGSRLLLLGGTLLLSGGRAPLPGGDGASTEVFRAAV
ncbi:MAG TPA: hypothetical protein VHG91_02225 [Longimicrobium sp.]|nr:hypothetical protein [Longimicrobium sp.]